MYINHIPNNIKHIFALENNCDFCKINVFAVTDDGHMSITGVVRVSNGCGEGIRLLSCDWAVRNVSTQVHSCLYFTHLLD
jgi:hypothetical protein